MITRVLSHGMTLCPERFETIVCEDGSTTVSFTHPGSDVAETATDIMPGFVWRGIRVFVGDIVLAEISTGAMFGGAVVYSEADACFYVVNLSAGEQRRFSDISRIEVLGNIFDNPDLREIVEEVAAPSAGPDCPISADTETSGLPEGDAPASTPPAIEPAGGEDPDAGEWYSEGFDPDAVCIYTDGACIGNPGPAGSAYVIRSGDRFMRSGSVPLPGMQTNNIAEITAVLAALRALPQSCQIVLHSDSQYVVKAFNDGWLKNWQRNGWRTQSGPVKNRELWEQLLAEAGDHDITWVWVRGHAGNEDNELCDRLAVAASRKASKADNKEGKL